MILNGYDVDLTSDISMPLNYAIADIRNPDKKNTNFSKTIIIPSTSVNDKLFGFLWDTNINVNSSGTTNYTPSFNPNKKAEVQILYEGAEIFYGYLKLDRITILQDYSIVYEVTCYGKLKDLMLAVGDRLMNELDLSKYNHTYTLANQQASWNNYIYINGIQTAFVKGEGYVYGMIDYALNDDVNYKVSHFFPQLYYKTVIREIVNQAGYQFDGSIFSDVDFKSLCVEYGKGSLSLSNTQIGLRTHQASNTTALYALSSGTNNVTSYIFNDDTTTPNNDAGGVYNTATGIFTANKAGTYKLTFQVSATVTYYPSTASPTIANNSYLGYFEMYKNSLPINSIRLDLTKTGITGSNQCVIFDSSPVTSGATSPTGTYNLAIVSQLAVGDTVQCKFKDFFLQTAQTNAFNQTPSASSYLRVNINTPSYFKSEMADVTVNEGDTVDMNNLLPATIKQKDFLSSFFKMFNIYTEDDRYSSNLMHFETQPDFYASSGTTRDWSKKLDISQPYKVVPMGDLDAGNYLYKFKDDTDYWNDYYKKKYNETYGQTKYIVENDWLNNTNVTESIFSPTPLVDRVGSDRVIPRIFQLSSNGQAIPKVANMRLLYYGGLKTTTTSWNHIASSGTTQMSTFPYVGHLDDPTSPTFDVNYYTPIEVFYTATSYTNNNFFNKYYKEFIQNITSKNSKIFEGYFHLTPLDIAILNFRDSYFFKGDYWRLNKISDYNPVEETKPTLCEFVKLIGGVPFTPTVATTKGGKDVALGTDDEVPTYMERLSFSGNYVGNQVLNSGRNNNIATSATGIIVTGDNNSIGEFATNVSILNSSGTNIPAGARNVTIINSNDVTVTNIYDTYTVIDGHVVGAKRLLYKTGSYKGLSTDLGHMVIFSLSAAGNYDLPEPDNIFNGWSVEIKNKTNAGYAITVTIANGSTSPFFEDGISTTATVNSGESFTYTYRSNIWYIT